MMDTFEQILSDSRLTSHHVSLYFALLIKAWQEGQPIAITREKIMQQSKIRSRKTYTRCLYELHAWNYLRYQPANNQFQTSEITLAMPTNDHSRPSAMQKSEHRNSSAMPINAHSKPSAMQKSGHSNSFAMPINGPSNLDAMPTNEHSILKNNAENQGNRFAMPKNEPSKPTAPPSPSSSTSKRSNSIFINAAGGGGGDVVPRTQPKKLPTDHPFTESPYFDWPTFQAAFAVGNRHRNVDLRYYYDALCDWRDRESGLPPLRSDWLRTARVFMRNDAKNHKLALLSSPQPNPPALQSAQPQIINNEKYRRPQ